MTSGHPLAYFDPATFADVAGLEYSAPAMAEDTVWVLTLSPPDPNAGTWSGTIGAGGVIIWPTGIDPNPPPSGDCGLDDQHPAGLTP